MYLWLLLSQNQITKKARMKQYNGNNIPSGLEPVASTLQWQNPHSSNLLFIIV